MKSHLVFLAVVLLIAGTLAFTSQRIYNAQPLIAEASVSVWAVDTPIVNQIDSAEIETTDKGVIYQKIVVCHNGHSVSVSKTALRAHLAHGDTEGPCD